VLAIFASAAAAEAEGGLFNNPWVLIIMVFLAIYIFLKFCTWAKNFQLSGSVKKWVFIITALAVVFFNMLYSQGNAKILASGDWSGATTALLASLAWVFFFAFVLMAETKPQ
jgi:predicted neutral ceramidase superfamily lipid hydrolase